VGVLRVVIAIAAASSVVTKRFVTLKWLAAQDANDEPRSSIDNDKALLGGYQTVADLKLAYENAIEQRRDALQSYFQSPNDVAKRTQAETADKWAIALAEIQSQVLEQASFARVRHSYTLARWGGEPS
jgi:hypothetical protein